MKPVPILYVDIDGTIRKSVDELGHFVNSINDVDVYPEVPQILKSYKDKGWRIVGVSNQGGVALGYMTADMCGAIMMETNRQCFDLFDKIMFCRHHPDAKKPEDRICWCRKPRPGMVIEEATILSTEHPNEYYPPHLALFVGDSKEDEQCALVANIRFIDAKVWRNAAAHPAV